MAQKTISDLFNNFVGTLQPKKTTTPIYPTPTGNSPKVTGVLAPTSAVTTSNSSATSPKTATFGDKGQYTYNVDSKGSPYGSPIKTTTTPSPKTNLPPVGQEFVNSLNKGKTGTTDTSGGIPTSTTQTTPTTPTVSKNPYQTYLESLFDPEKLKTAQTNIDSLNERTSSELLRNRAKEDELRKNDIGQLERGQSYQMGEEERLSNKSLADLAIAKGASIDTINQIMTAGKEAYAEEKPIEIDGALYQKGADGTYSVVAGTPGGAGKTGAEAGFTLSPGEVRFDAQGNQIASGGAKPMSAAQEADAIAKTEKQVAAQQSASQSIGLVNNLLADDSYKSIFGLQSPFNLGILGGGALSGNAQAINQYDQLQGLLKLGVRGLIKGQGAVSDYEGKILGQAASSLGRNLNNEQGKQALQTVRGVLKTNNGQVTSVTVTNPETGEKVTADLSGAEIYQLTNDGNLITYN